VNRHISDFADQVLVLTWFGILMLSFWWCWLNPNLVLVCDFTLNLGFLLVLFGVVSLGFIGVGLISLIERLLINLDVANQVVFLDI